MLLGVEIGGTKLQLGLGLGDGRLLAFRRLQIVPESGAEGILTQIAGAVDPLLADLGETRDRLEAVGIGFGGPVDADRGVVIKSHQVAGWEAFAIADWARQTLGIARVALQNDADTAGFGEARFGAGVGLSPIVYVTVGSGIGGALIVDGRIYRGAGLGAVEIGHLATWGCGDAPGAGPRTLEERASGWSIGARGRECLARLLAEGRDDGTLAPIADGRPDRVDAFKVVEAAKLGDPEAVAVLGSAVEAMAQGFAQAATLLGPRRIILGGGVSSIGEALWFGPIREKVDRLVFPPYRSSFDIVAAALGDEVVVHGALALARDAVEAQ